MLEDTVIGRLDVHYTDVLIHATLNVNETVSEDGIQDIFEDAESELFDAVGIVKHEIAIHVYRGKELGVYGQNYFDGNDGGEMRFN